jgi:hypothetical protein
MKSRIAKPISLSFDEHHWLKDISAAINTCDPAQANRSITLVHYQLSQALHAVTGPDTGANFHTWAVWGSRKAGVTIRQEDLADALHNATIVAGIVGLFVGLVISALAINFWLFTWSWFVLVPAGLFGFVCGALTGRWIATYSRREAARLILEGNRIVLGDIGKQTARFVSLFHDKSEADANLLETFLSELRPGDTASGGQDLLRRAFSNYYTARYSNDLKQKHEATYFANCLAVLHEHIRLEPYIKKSMPFIIRKCATKRLMQFDVGRVKLKVSEAVPKLDGLEFPGSLQDLRELELIEFLNGRNGWSGDLKVAPASDWTNIRERMRYIVQLFRVMHLEGSVFAEPFSSNDNG